jgi:hypothetical protein
MTDRLVIVVAEALDGYLDQWWDEERTLRIASMIVDAVLEEQRRRESRPISAEDLGQ